MKPHTRILSLFAALAVFLAAILCESLLPKPQEKEKTQGSCTVVVQGMQTDVYEIDLSEVAVTEGLFSILQYLKSEKGLSYDIEESTYGAYIRSVGTILPDASCGEYVALFTSVGADADVSAYATSAVYEGRELTSSGVGASSMHIEDGALILLALRSY